MHAELHGLFSPDFDDLEHGLPPDATCFGLLVQAVIGPRGSADSESFDFLVCTPTWLAGTVRPGEYRFGHGLSLMGRYDYRLLHAAFTKLCNRTERPDWASIGERLQRYGEGEFADYRPAPEEGAS